MKGGKTSYIEWAMCHYGGNVHVGHRTQMTGETESQKCAKREENKEGERERERERVVENTVHVQVGEPFVLPFAE